MRTLAKIGVVLPCLAALLWAFPSVANFDWESASGVWLFNEGQGKVVSDRSGNGNDGELIDSPTWVDGRFGKALEFNGGNYVAVEETVGLPLMWEPRTVMAWFKLAEVGGDYEIVGYGPFNSPGWFGLFIDAEDALGHDNTNWRVQFLADWEADKEWHHVAVALPEGERTKLDQLNIYVDGEPLVGRMVGAKSQIVLTAEGPVLIGVGSMRQAAYFNGIIDEVAIFPTELSRDEIADIATNGLEVAQAVSPSGKLATSWAALKER